MVTIRELIELNIWNDKIRDHFERYRGNTPMCCWKRKGTKLTCTWLKEFYEIEEFERLCLQCQKEIERRLYDKGIY